MGLIDALAALLLAVIVTTLATLASDECKAWL